MDSQKYWRRRTIEREKKWHELTDKELRELKKYYVAASKDLEKEIGLLYAKFGKDNALSIQEARKLIRGDEFKEWRMTLQEYVKRAQGDPKILRELNTLAMRRRVSRLEALHARTLMELMDLGNRLQDTTDNQLYKAYLDTYYGSLYDFHKTIGLNTPPAAVDRPRVESVLQTTWSGKNYSSRIWTNTRKLAGEVKSTMLQAIHRGYSIQRLSKNLSERMGVAYKNAERLVRTELNAVENRASAAAMKEADFENYQYCAAMDRRTCARCGELDGEIFPLSAMNQGENAPPLHPRCRCTIVATFDSPGKRGKTSGERAARDENGRRTRVPADMNYRDWKAVYIDKTKTFDAWQKEFDAQHPDKPKSTLGARNYDSELAKTIGKARYDQARDLVEHTQHTKAAQVWTKFEDKIKVELLNNGKAHHQSGRIYIDMARYWDGTGIHSPCEVLFHEAGHLIDYLKKIFVPDSHGGRTEYFSLNYQSKAFVKAIKKDFKALVDSRKPQVQAELNAKIAAGDRDWLFNEGYISYSQLRGGKIPDNIKVPAGAVHKFLAEELEKAHSLIDRANFSDVFSGQTNGKYDLRAGHTKSYWRFGGDHCRATEAFAEFFSSAITNPASYAIMKQYLPTAEKIFNEMLDELLKVA